MKAALVVLPAWMLGCSGNSLQGSIIEVVPDLATFQAVAVAIDPGTTLAVSYYDPTPAGCTGNTCTGRDTLFKIAVNLGIVGVVPDGGSVRTLLPGAVVDLTPDYTNLAKATCSRTVTNDPRNNYAPIKVGQFTVDKLPQEGQPESGNFRVTFGAGGDVGEGRTAFGTFTTTQVVTAVGL